MIDKIVFTKYWEFFLYFSKDSLQIQIKAFSLNFVVIWYSSHLFFIYFFDFLHFNSLLQEYSFFYIFCSVVNLIFRWIRSTSAKDFLIDAYFIDLWSHSYLFFWIKHHQMESRSDCLMAIMLFFLLILLSLELLTQI